MVGKYTMRWNEIIYLIEDSPDEELKSDLSALFGMLKVKNIDSVPLDQVIGQITYGGMKISPDDDSAKSNIIDIITSMDGIVDKVENNMVYLVNDKPAEYSPSEDKEKKDQSKVNTKATKMAQKNLKDKK